MIDKTSNNPNILYISPTFVGGIGGHAFRVSEKLNQNGFDIELMKIPHIPIKNLKNPSFTIFGKIKTMFHKKSYDLVHAWNIPSGIIMKNIKAKKKFYLFMVYTVNKLKQFILNQLVNWVRLLKKMQLQMQMF